MSYEPVSDVKVSWLTEKITIAKMLDSIRIDMIEAGDPSVSDSNFNAIKEIFSQ